jgi:hypothetical protein
MPPITSNGQVAAQGRPQRPTVLTVLTQTPPLQGDIAAGRDLCARDAFKASLWSTN